MPCSWLGSLITTAYKNVRNDILRCLNLKKDETVTPMTKFGELLSHHSDIPTGGFQLQDNTHKHKKFSAKKLEWWKHMLAGGAGGVTSRTLTAPLDRLKIIIQTSAANKKQPHGFINCFRIVLAEGGVRSFWRGNLVNCLKVTPETAVKFLVFEGMKEMLCTKDQGHHQLHPYQRFLAGATAGIVSQSFVYPMEVLKIRLAVGTTGEYKSLFDCIQQLYRKRGLCGFYRGIMPTIIGVIPNAGIDLCIYETLKQNWIHSHEDPRRPTLFVSLFSGTVSSSFSMAVCYPFAVVKTNMLTDVRATMDGKPLTMVGMFRSIVRDHGFRGLYRGIVPNAIKVVPVCSISYVVYEKTKECLEGEW